MTASGSSGENPSLEVLPVEVRSTAIVLSNGEVMWARQDAEAALRAIRTAGGRILGLDLRSDGPGTIPQRGVPTEIPWTDCSSATSEEALVLALDDLGAIADRFPDHPWVLVTWERAPTLGLQPRESSSPSDRGVVCRAQLDPRA